MVRWALMLLTVFEIDEELDVEESNVSSFVDQSGAASTRPIAWVPLYPTLTRGFRSRGIFGGGFIGRGYFAASVNMHFLTAALKNLEPRIDDDFIDRLNYYYTPSVIIIFAILVSAKQYVGHPIECWVPGKSASWSNKPSLHEYRPMIYTCGSFPKGKLFNRIVCFIYKTKF